jgi:hypothetical protein
MPEWFVSSLMMDRALDAIVRRAKTLDRKHDIPYLAGYSKDGKTIYIDRHMPSSFRYDGRDINTDRYLILHEEVEKTLIDQLNLHYLHAHQIATRAEEAAVRAAGIRWRDYDRFMQKYVKRIGDARLTKVTDVLSASSACGLRESRAAVARQVPVVPALFCVANCCCRGRNDIPLRGRSPRAQQLAKILRIGILRRCARPFRQALRELGYVEGQNIAYEYRYGEVPAQDESVPYARRW